jgi:uncharacterized protein (TIGR02145 family)
MKIYFKNHANLFAMLIMVQIMAFTLSCSDNFINNLLGDPSSSSNSDSEPVVHGGQEYKTVVIGSQTWMKENLNYEVSGSKCYNNYPDNCEKYGRMYSWAAAMNLSENYNFEHSHDYIDPVKHKGICPEGWHVPNNKDWDQLVRYVDGTNGTGNPYASRTAGKHLKAAENWEDKGNGMDTYEFAAFPGGFLNDSLGFIDAGYSGNWWSSSENGSEGAYTRRMAFNSDSVIWYGIYKKEFLSVRCVKDNNF